MLTVFSSSRSARRRDVFARRAYCARATATSVGGIVVTLLTAIVVSACNIPVFRYALERWRPDPFDAVVFHRGPLDATQQALLDKWKSRSIESYGQEEAAESANFELTVVDLESPKAPAELRKLWEQIAQAGKDEPALPHLVFRAPGDPRKPLVALHGPLSDDLWMSACDSPTRREVIRRLLSGHAIVWLFLPGADAEENARIEKLLDEQLPALEEKISLPEGIGTDGFDLLTDVPLEIKFSRLSLQRDAREEQSLLTMLAAHFPPVSDRQQALVLPVFGCGRVLDAIVQQDLDAEVLSDASEFLCGACSCQVKNLNPGVDLLVSADWDKLLSLAGRPEESSASSSRSETPPAEPKYVPIPRSTQKPAVLETAAAPGTATEVARSTPAISPSTAPLPVDTTDAEMPPTYGTSRTNRDQSERWPTSITAMMIVIGTIAVATLIFRTRERRRIRQQERDNQKNG